MKWFVRILAFINLVGAYGNYIMGDIPMCVLMVLFTIAWVGVSFLPELNERED